MVPTWKTKNGKTSKFVDAGGYNTDERGRERERERERNWRFEMDRQTRVKRENKFTLGPERCENF